MKQFVSTITSKGQVTIPAAVRKHLGVGTSDKVTFVIEAEGTVRLESPRYPDIASLRGAAGSLPRPLEWTEVEETARQDHLREEYGSR